MLRVSCFKLYPPHEMTPQGGYLTGPVLEAANGKAVRLAIGIAVDRGVAGIQIPIPSRGTTLQRRPKVVVGAEIVEGTIRIAVAGKQAWRISNRLIASCILERIQEVRTTPETYHLRKNK